MIAAAPSPTRKEPIHLTFPRCRPIRAPRVNDNSGPGRSAIPTVARPARNPRGPQETPRWGVDTALPSGIGTHCSCWQSGGPVKPSPLNIVPAVADAAPCTVRSFWDTGLTFRATRTFWWHRLKVSFGEGFRTPALCDGEARRRGRRSKASQGGNRGEEGLCRATYGDLRVADGAPAQALRRQADDRVDRKDDDELVRSCKSKA